MNKKEYFARIDSLVVEAESLLNENKVDEARAKREEAERLMNNWDQYALDQANQAALLDRHIPIDLSNESLKGITGKVIERIDFGGGSVNLDNRFIATEEYKNAFIKTLQGTGTQEQKNMVTVATGGSIIPESIYEAVLENIRKQQGMLAYVRILNIPGKVVIPLSDINEPAIWHVEGQDIADSTLPPTNLTLSGFELVKLFSMSAAAKAMSVPAFESYLVEELTRCMGDALNQAVFTGTGNGQPTGIETGIVFGTTNLVTTAVKTLAYDDLTEAMGLMASNFRQRAAWVMNSKTLYNYVATMKDTTGRPIFNGTPTVDTPLMLLGKPVIVDDFCGDDLMYLADPQGYIINFSQPITVLKSDEAGFTTNSTIYKSSSVVDGKPMPTGAFIKVAIPQA